MIIIHAAANRDIGIGHLIRVNSLGIALKKSGLNPHFVFESSQDILQSVIDHSMNYDLCDTREEANLLVEKKILDSPDDKKIYITDLLNLTKKHKMRFKSLGVDLLIHLNDSNKDVYFPDVWINGDAFNLEPANDCIIPTQLIGAKYAILRPEIVHLKPMEFREQLSSPEQVLISFGGADPGNYTESFIEEICIHKKEMKFQIVIGPAFSGTRMNHIEKITDKLDNIDLIIKPDGLSHFLLQSDIFISLGGISAYEAMCLGCPVLALEWEGMTSYVEKLDRFGFVTSLGNIEEAPSRFNKSILNFEQINKNAFKAWHAIDGKGATRVADFITTYLYE